MTLSSNLQINNTFDSYSFWRNVKLIFLIVVSVGSIQKRDVHNGLSRKGLSAYTDGQIMLGALMMVHERQNEPLICGDVMSQGGVQAVEAMLYTLDYINSHEIVPYTKLGAMILDDCDKDTYGLQQSVEFIKGKMSSIESGYTCTLANSSEKYSLKPITGVVAASSSVTSIQVANLLKLFRIPQVSFFSTSAELSSRERFPYFFRTIPSDAWQVEAMKDIIVEFRWTYVSLIYEESSYGKVAMSSLEEKLRSHNVCIAVKAALPKDSDVANDDQYDLIVEMLLNKQKAKAVVIYGSDQEVQGLVRALSRKNATNRFTFVGSDGWSGRALVYEGGYEKEVLGTISLQPQASPIRGFKEYFENLSVESNTRNPWFYEMWEREFRCRYQSKPETLYNQNFTRICTGRENQMLINGRSPYAYEQQLQFVSDATLVFAYALRDFFHNRCTNDRRCIACHHSGSAGGAGPLDGGGLVFQGDKVTRRTRSHNRAEFNAVNFADDTDADFRAKLGTTAGPGRKKGPKNAMDDYAVGACDIDGGILKEFIQNVSFNSLIEGDRKSFRFELDKSDPTPKYNIIHFRSISSLKRGKAAALKTVESNGEQKRYQWITVGTWEKDKPVRLNIDYDLLKFYVNDAYDGAANAPNSKKKHPAKKSPSSLLPVSTCYQVCKSWEVRVYPLEGDKCCFSCSPCPPYQFKFNDNQCKECANGTQPSQDRLDCIPLPLDVVHLGSSYGIVCMSIAILGTASTIFLLVIFILHNNTPIVRASGRELSYVIIFGLFLCFAVTPVTLTPPSPSVCGIQRFLSGFCFTVVYAAILTKTNRIARIFRSGRRTIRRPHFISPESQLLICLGISGVQIILVGLWLYSKPPYAGPHYPTRKDNMLVCREAVSNNYLLAYAYPILLCIVCTVYAYKTRKMPEAFNESHYIGAAVYTTCVIWLAFVPVYIVAKESNQIRATSVCVSTSLTALVCQFCLFWPKVYIIVFKPERNVRQALMGPKVGGGSVSKSLLHGVNSGAQVSSLSVAQITSASTAISASSGASSGHIDRSDSSCCSDDETQLSTTKRSDPSHSTSRNLKSVATQTDSSRNFPGATLKAGTVVLDGVLPAREPSSNARVSTRLVPEAKRNSLMPSHNKPDHKLGAPASGKVRSSVISDAIICDGNCTAVPKMSNAAVAGGTLSSHQAALLPAVSSEVIWIDNDESPKADRKMPLSDDDDDSEYFTSGVPQYDDEEIKWEVGDVPL